MKFLPLIAIAFFAVTVTKAQVAWLKTVDNTVNWQGIVCDEDGDAYLYGFNGTLQSNSEGKSVWIARYSMNGERRNLAAIQVPVNVTQMVHDGSNLLFFTGNISGEFAFNGTKYTSRSEKAGVVGSVDEAGALQWLTVLDGSELNGIAWNALTRRLAVTGAVKGDFYAGNQLIESVREQSMLLAELSPGGKLIRYRLDNFVTESESRNVGKEIVSNSAGGYFMLGLREGKPWTDGENGEKGNAYDGHYVFSIDHDLRVKWQRMVINGFCYYGNVSGVLKTDGYDVMVTTYCSGKYGGNGKLIRMNGIDGSEHWFRGSTDATFRDACVTGDRTIFLVADDANGCPCEANHPGYEALREIDGSKNESLLIKCGGRGMLKKVMQNNHGITYIFGAATDQFTVGEFSVTGNTFLFALGNPPRVSATALESVARDGSVNIFPNPSPGLFTLNAPRGFSSISVTDITGRRMTAACRQIGESSWQVDCTPFTAGAYYLSVITADGTVVKRVMIQR